MCEKLPAYWRKLLEEFEDRLLDRAVPFDS
jgi:hypothetical protein